MKRTIDVWADPRVERLAELAPERRARLLARGRHRLRELRPAVAAILEDVRARGDAAVLEYAERFDGGRPAALRVPEAEIAAALDRVDADYAAALRRAARNIEAFHRAQMGEEPPIETEPGVRVWRVWRPLERIGVYVPGGGALYPSCLLMAAVPARVAGVAEVAVCTPAGAGGRVPDAVLAAAAIAGVREVYAVGGVQAIGALAYGTEAIRRVDKIFGPGSAYVAAAKALVASEVAVDLPAGPSEVLIVADGEANPAWVAADLLAQAEHGPESACVLVTTSPELAEAVRAEVARQLERLATADVIRASLAAHGALLVADSPDAALDFANAYAAEHLELHGADAEAWLPRVRHAGSVFLGQWSAVAAGDYATGGNHTLPTAGYARGFGPLALEAFGRKMQVQRLTADGLAGLRPTIERLAATEGLPAHAASVGARFAAERGSEA
jgi:histidinol dehydrogenase